MIYVQMENLPLISEGHWVSFITGFNWPQIVCFSMVAMNQFFMGTSFFTGNHIFF